MASIFLKVATINVKPGKYKKFCTKNKDSKSCHLIFLNVSSELSCFKECQFINHCESVNILPDNVAGYRCQLNCCIEHSCKNNNITTQKYNYFYKTSKRCFLQIPTTNFLSLKKGLKLLTWASSLLVLIDTTSLTYSMI